MFLPLPLSTNIDFIPLNIGCEEIGMHNAMTCDEHNVPLVGRSILTIFTMPNSIVKNSSAIDFKDALNAGKDGEAEEGL